MKCRLSIALTLCLFVCGCGQSRDKNAVPDLLATGVSFSERASLSDQLYLPSESNDQPWNVGEALPVATKRIRLDHLLPKKYNITGGVIATRSGRAMLTYMDRTQRRIKSTFAILCDIKNGEVLGHWQIRDYLAPYCIHPDGTQVIFCRKDAVRSRRETLYIADVSAVPGELEMETWLPLVDSNTQEEPKLFVKEWEIMWAEYVGDYIVTLNHTGKLHVWHRDTLSRVAMVDNVVGLPALTPDARKVVFVTGDTLAMLDPAVPGITNAIRIGQPPEEPAVAIQASGQMAAIGGKGQAFLVDLKALKRSAATIDRLEIPPSMRLRSNFHWIGNFLHTYNDLYNLYSPIPVWRIRVGSWHTVHDGQVWSVVRDRDQRTHIYFRSFDIPASRIEKHVQRFFESSDIVALRRGEYVQVDVSRMPEELQSQTYDDLIRLLEDAGFGISSRAKISVVASIGQPKRTKIEYFSWTHGKEGRQFTYDIRKARLEFVRDGDTLWKRTKHEFPPMSIAELKIPSTEFVKEWGNPDLTLFSETKLPTYVLGTDRSNHRGETVLSANGIKTYPPKD